MKRDLAFIARLWRPSIYDWRRTLMDSQGVSL